MIIYMVFISLCVLGYIGILCADSHKYLFDVIVSFFVSILVFFVVLFGGSILTGVGYGIVGALWGILIPVWFIDFLIGMSFMVAGACFRYKYNNIRVEGSISGKYYKFKERWVYGNFHDMSDIQKIVYHDDVAENLKKLL